MSPRLYSRPAASSPAEEFNWAFLWNTSIRTQRQRERGRKKEEKLYSALCHGQPRAQELNAANPSGVEECGEGGIMWHGEDNISSPIWDCFQLKGSQLTTRLFEIYSASGISCFYLHFWKYSLTEILSEGSCCILIKHLLPFLQLMFNSSVFSGQHDKYLLQPWHE